MKSGFLLVCIWFFKFPQEVFPVDVDINSRLDEYLEKQSNFKEFFYSRNKVTAKRDVSNIEQQNIAEIRFPKSQEHARFFSFGEEIYILLTNKILLISSINNSYDLTTTNFLLDKVSSEDQIVFSKHTKSGNRNMLLIKLKSGDIHIYEFKQGTMSFVQSLFAPESKDFHFFENNNHLYLIVVNDNAHLAVTSVYKWLGSHFDEIQTIFTMGAIKVASFSARESEILIILQTLENKMVYSDVYKFRNDMIKKIQRIDTVLPSGLDIITEKYKKYVIIYERTANNSLFHWNGFQLTRISQVISQSPIHKHTISKINDTSLIMSASSFKVQLLQLFPKSFKMAEVSYISNYLNIFDVYTRENETSLITFTVGLTPNNTINISVMSFRVNFDKMEVDGEENKNVRECYDNLETRLYDFKRKQNATRRKLEKSDLFDDNDSTQDPTKAILSQSLVQVQESALESRVNTLENKLKNIKSVLQIYEDFDENNITMNGTLVFKGTVMADKILSKNTKIKNLNGKKWIPEQWLKYDEPQTITGLVKISAVVTENLELSLNDSLLQNVLLKNSNQTISGLVTVNETKVNGNIYSKKINEIPFNKICLKNNPNPITGLKIFENLEADEAEIKSPNELKEITSGRFNRTFDSSITVENLEVESVNGILWDEFQNSVFRVGVSDLISGSITIPKIKTEKLRTNTLNSVNVDDLFTTSTSQTIAANITFKRIFAENITADTINGIKLTEAVTFGDATPIKGPVTFDKLNVVKDMELSGNFDKALFTKSGDHIIGTNESDLLQIYRGKVKIKGNLVLKNFTLQENATLIVAEEELPNITNTYWTKNTNQKIPFNVTIKNGLKIPYILLKSLNGVRYNQYMVNNNNDDFETDYHFKDVIVTGNVILNNTAKNKPDLHNLNKQAVKTNGTFLINGQKKYIDTLKTDNLVTMELEGINTFEALNKTFKNWLINVNGTKIFKNITVKGHLNGIVDNVDVLNNISIANFKDNLVFTDKKQNYRQINFEHLNEYSFSLLGEFLSILFNFNNGIDFLIDRDLFYLCLVDVSVKNAKIQGQKLAIKPLNNLLRCFILPFPRKRDTIKFFIEKYSDEISSYIVILLMSSNNLLKMSKLKKIIDDLLKKMPAKETTNLYIERLNGHAIDDLIVKLNELKSLNKIDNLIISDNLTINNAEHVSTINEITSEQLLNNPRSKKGKLGGILIDVSIAGKLKLNNLATTFINDINLVNLTSRLLYKNISQNITGSYHFTNIKTENIFTSKINKFSVQNLIDVSTTKAQFIQAPSEFYDGIILKYLYARSMSPCSIEELFEKVNSPPTQNWHTIEITDNVTLLDEESDLYRIFEKTVSRRKANIVSAPVNFSENVFAKTVTLKKDINNVDIIELFEDAITTDPETEQHITGIKWFTSIRTKQAVVYKNADIPTVNSEWIELLDNDIIDRNTVNSTVIRGMKTFFGGLQSENFNSNTISNIDPENIVNLDSPKKVPTAIFDSLKILNNFNISFVNNMNVTDILNKRLLLTSPETQFVNAVYYFDDLTVEKMTTPSINNTNLDEVIFDNNEEQNIFSKKLFMDNVTIFGNVQVDIINSINISKEFENAIIDEDFFTINGSITVLEPSLVNGSISTEFINGYPISEIRQILENSNTKTDIGEILKIKNKMIEGIKKNLPVAQNLPTEYMYLEKSHSFQISVPEVLSATSITSKGYVLIHINGEISGKYCNFNNNCQCPTQYSIEISPEQSVALLPNKGVKRIFSYDDKSMIVHFVTNTISRSSKCRASTKVNLLEGSKMTWTTSSVANNSGSFFQYNDVIRGYISKVEFFTLNGKSYAIIGKSYDPFRNTHNLDTVVIRFNENRTSANEIQNIPTKGVEELYLFYTAQGVILIIGNVKENEEETQIYQFDANKEQFDLLRIVPFFGCSGATGVVFGTDSLIVLRHRFSSVQILKYYPEFKNYFHYQSFDLEERVIGVSVFYSAGFGKSDAYLVLTTDNNNFYIYSYKFVEGWILKSSGKLEGLKNLIPIEQNEHSYLFAASTENSSLLTIVQNGSD